MTIQSLAPVSLTELTGTFNEAFADYYVKLQLTEPAMALKLRSENIDLTYSVGAFDGGKLRGFILHGIDVLAGVKTVYNAGTGVVSAYRGHRLTEQLYQAVLPVLKRQGMVDHQLEVIEQNKPARRVYEKVGFERVRTFSCFKGIVKVPADAALSVGETAVGDFETYARFWNFQPSWQNDTPAIRRATDAHKVVELKKDAELIAYAAFMPATGRVKQYGVNPKHRGKGYGRQLFGYLCSISPNNEVNLINIDEQDGASIAFFRAMGFQRFLGLWEMKFKNA